MPIFLSIIVLKKVLSFILNSLWNHMYLQCFGKVSSEMINKTKTSTLLVFFPKFLAKNNTVYLNTKHRCDERTTKRQNNRKKHLQTYFVASRLTD